MQKKTGSALTLPVEVWVHFGPVRGRHLKQRLNCLLFNPKPVPG